VGFDGVALAGIAVPFQAHGNTGIHAAAATTLAVPRAQLLGLAHLNGHIYLNSVMLELKGKAVNGTSAGDGANE
jgi:hypothetical protein